MKLSFSQRSRWILIVPLILWLTGTALIAQPFPNQVPIYPNTDQFSYVARALAVKNGALLTNIVVKQLLLAKGALATERTALVSLSVGTNDVTDMGATADLDFIANDNSTLPSERIVRLQTVASGHLLFIRNTTNLVVTNSAFTLRNGQTNWDGLGVLALPNGDWTPTLPGETMLLRSGADGSWSEVNRFSGPAGAGTYVTNIFQDVTINQNFTLHGHATINNNLFITNGTILINGTNVAALNPTDLYLPARSGTNFMDSSLRMPAVGSTNIIANGKIQLAGVTNNLYRVGAHLTYENAASETNLRMVNQNTGLGLGSIKWEPNFSTTTGDVYPAGQLEYVKANTWSNSDPTTWDATWNLSVTDNGSTYTSLSGRAGTTLFYPSTAIGTNNPLSVDSFLLGKGQGFAVRNMQGASLNAPENSPGLIMLAEAWNAGASPSARSDQVLAAWWLQAVENGGDPAYNVFLSGKTGGSSIGTNIFQVAYNSGYTGTGTKVFTDNGTFQTLSSWTSVSPSGTNSTISLSGALAGVDKNFYMALTTSNYITFSSLVAGAQGTIWINCAGTPQMVNFSGSYDNFSTNDVAPPFSVTNRCLIAYKVGWGTDSTNVILAIKRK